MSLNAAAIAVMVDRGMTADDILAVAEALEIKKDRTGAERQARYRERKAAERDEVTRYVTRDDGFNDKDILTSQEELPQEAKASLPQRAKTKRYAVPWPCPPRVDPRHWQDFLAARKRKRCVQSQTALDGVLADIDRIADDEWPPGRLVQHAAAKGWASINDPRKPLIGQPNGQQQIPGLGKTTAAIAGLGDWNDDRPM